MFLLKVCFAEFSEEVLKRAIFVGFSIVYTPSLAIPATYAGSQGSYEKGKSVVFLYIL